MRHAVLALALAFISPQQDPTVPANATPLVKAQGIGVQIYQCNAGSGGDAWELQGPEANLFDPATQEKVGTHAAGPVWTWKDKSSVQGKVLQQLPSPNAGSVPWLLLEAKPAGNVEGVLSRVTYVRRSDTQGGNAPATGCDAANVGTILRVPYLATYTFYAVEKK